MSSGDYGGPGGPGGPGPQGATSSSANTPTIYAPIKGGPPGSTNTGEGGGGYGAGRDGGTRLHAGIDVAVSIGTACVAPVDGKVVAHTTSGFAGGGMLHFQFKEDLGDIKAGDIIGWGHVFGSNNQEGGPPLVNAGTDVQGGKVIGTSGGGPGGAHVHFVYIPKGTGPSTDGTADPTQVYNFLRQGEAPTGLAENGVAGAGGGGGEGLAKAAAFATFFNLATVTDRVRSQVLTGERSLMNDEPLFPFIQQVTEASLRNFQSMPNGNFFAFYPDYFGGLNHRTAYWKIQDIEIIDGNINLSDDALATHVYVVGSWEGTGYAPTAIDAFRELQSAGVVTVFNAFALDFLNGTTNMTGAKDPFEKSGSDEGLTAEQRARKRNAKDNVNAPNVARKDNAIAFLQKYGARPDYQQMPLVKSRYYEIFLAYQRFCLLWSQQFSTEFELTFMPELFPGGIVEFADHGIQCYIEEVSHNCSYSGGFTTNVVLSAPASTNKNTPKDQNKNIGMIRSGIFAPGAIQAPGSG